MSAVIALALVASFASLNRAWGSMRRLWPVLAGLVMAVALWLLTHDWLLTASPVIFLCARSASFGLFGGSTTPMSLKEILGSFLRFELAALAYLIIAATENHAAWAYVATLTVFAALALWVSHFYAVLIEDLKASQRPETGENIAVELAHGALFGLAIAAAAMIVAPQFMLVAYADM